MADRLLFSLWLVPRPECLLGRTQSEIILVLALFDYLLVRNVLNERISRSKQEEIRENARKPPITVFERVNGEKLYNEVSDDEERMNFAFKNRLLRPFHKLQHFFAGQICGRGVE